MTVTRMDRLDLLRELEPTAAANLDRHLRISKEWMPHEYVPWSRGRDFDTEPYEEGQSTLGKIAQVAFEVNLLTEDNLPSYHHEIVDGFGRDGAWGTWVNRWTAEEGRHAIVMRDYLLVTRGVDPDALERGRMAQMQVGYVADGKDALDVMAYVSFQELATRISHRNTGRYTEDPIADKLLARVAADENLHMVFYRDLITKALELTPSQTVVSIKNEVLGFEMPGTGIADFGRKAAQMARAGIYDLRIHHDQVLKPLLTHWGYFELEGLDAEAEQARTAVAEHLEAIDGLARAQEEKAAARAARAAAREVVPV
jgi:acyl-[acyl-carrier-protein] desaturase